ncbi:MAG: sensor histidine kinase [Flavihumibacter sp.]
MKNNRLGILQFFGSWWYLLLAFAVGIPFYALLRNVVIEMQVREDEAITFGITATFLLCVFAGRYIVQVLDIKDTRMPLTPVAGLSVLIVVSAVWFFFHADFPLNNRVAINMFLFVLPLVTGGLSLGALVKILRTVGKNRLDAALTEASGSKAELQLLQSQLSPHFLFNTLNNLYGLSLARHEKLPAMLLKLSDLLRYSVYEAGAPTVTLRDEWKYINDYIDFERLRFGERLELRMDMPDEMEGQVKLAPMLLIVPVENAFKHGRDTAADTIRISIRLQVWGDSILFSVVNPFAVHEQVALPANQHNGFGLVNLRKRLDLLYPGKHSLDIQSADGEFRVHLQLKIR